MSLADFKNSIITKDQFSGTFSKFDRSVQGSARGLDKLGGIISGGGLGMLFGATAGAAGAMAIGKVAFALGDLGAQAITTEASFNNLLRTIGTSPLLLDNLKQAANGTMTEMMLMQQASTALAGTSGQLSQEMANALPKLLEAGKAAAKLNPAYGDAAFMFQSLVSGVKRGAPLLIDNTGIVMKIGEATEAYAASLGKSADALTSQERSIAILRATLAGADTLIQQAGTSMDNMAVRGKQLKVAIEELKIALGTELAPTTSNLQGRAALEVQGMTAFVKSDELAAARVELARLEQAYQDGLKAQGTWLDNVTKMIYGEEAAAEALNARRQAVIDQRVEVNRLTNEYIGHINASEGARFATVNFGTSAAIAANNIGVLTFALRQAKEAAQGLGGSMGGVSAEYKAGLNSAFGQVYGMGSVIPESEANAIYGSFTRQYAQLELDKTTISRQEYTRRKADLDAALNAQLASYRKLGNDVSTIASDTTNDIKSKIGTALTPSFDLSGLTGGLLGGGGGDAFDEAYKRLAAVALRPKEMQIHAGDWADTFEQAGLTGLSPEEASQRARELVEAYSKGLDFSLIDREKIKDQVRQAIKAEELYNTIVDEIYAEMGKEKPKLAQAGTNIGNQLNRAATATVQSGARDYVGAWVSVLTPEIVKVIDARGRRTGQTQ